jgi:hypothetical protein
MRVITIGSRPAREREREKLTFSIFQKKES